MIPDRLILTISEGERNQHSPISFKSNLDLRKLEFPNWKLQFLFIIWPLKNQLKSKDFFRHDIFIVLTDEKTSRARGENRQWWKKKANQSCQCGKIQVVSELRQFLFGNGRCRLLWSMWKKT